MVSYDVADNICQALVRGPGSRRRQWDGTAGIAGCRARAVSAMWVVGQARGGCHVGRGRARRVCQLRCARLRGWAVQPLHASWRRLMENSFALRCSSLERIVDSIKTRVGSAYGALEAAILPDDETLSSFVFNYKLRRYSEAPAVADYARVIAMLEPAGTGNPNTAGAMAPTSGPVVSVVEPPEVGC